MNDNEIKTVNDIIDLNTFWCSTNHNWFGKQHKTNNPRGYVLEPDYKDEKIKEEYRKIRRGALIRLLELIYENFIAHGDKLDLNPVEQKRFKRYIYTEIIYNFPYKCFKDSNKEYLQSEIKIPGFDTWIEEILTYKTETKIGRNIYSNDKVLLETRRDVILRHFVAEVAHFINKLQVDDLAENINKQKNLVYGKKHALSAFLGQHIIRQFPFKEGIKFHSQTAKNSKDAKVVYEHWTPISFFRDLIWIEQPDTGKPKLFSPEEWYKILKYSYRTIVITKDEDLKLNQNKFKSKRPFNAYNHEKVNIQVDKDDKKLWETLHSI